MNRRFALLPACLLLALALAACGGAASATPTSVPEPAWIQFAGGGATLMLPDTYQTLDLSTGLDQRIAKLKQFGGRYERTAHLTERSRRSFALWAFDSRAGYSSCAATAGVIRTRSVSSALTLDLFVQEMIRQLPALAAGDQVRVVGQETVTLDRQPAARLLLEFPNACRKEVLYALKRGDRFWMVIYAADVKEFESRLPSFERSIQTFETTDLLKG